MTNTSEDEILDIKFVDSKEKLISLVREYINGIDTENVDGFDSSSKKTRINSTREKIYKCCYGKCKCCNCCVPKHVNDFWCSALVAFMYVKMGCFAEDLDWSDKTPAFLAREDTPIVEPYSLSKLWVLKK